MKMFGMKALTMLVALGALMIVGASVAFGLDLSSPIASAGADVPEDFETNLGAVVAIVLPVVFGVFLWRKARGLIR